MGFDLFLTEYGMSGFFISCLLAAIIYLAKRDDRRDKVFTDVINNNTKALSTFCEVKKKCEVKKNGRK